MKPLQSVGRFYFLDYFSILLRTVERHSRREDVFSAFKVLKQKQRLGESKYKRLTDDGEVLTQKQQQRYNYTFEQVVEESKQYGLILRNDEDCLLLTDKGKQLLRTLDEMGFESFLRVLANLMEDHFRAFRYLVEYLHHTNPRRSGVLVFPHYSPLQLDFRRKQVQTTGDIQRYCAELVRRLESDILKHLSRTLTLADENREIVNRLIDDGLLPPDPGGRFRPADYNKITKRIRDFWIIHFLKNLYQCNLTMSTFDFWVYRAKQIGIIHVTEFYPSTNGKLVYPTAVVLANTVSKDFTSIYEYSDGKRLFLHQPDSDTFREQFIKELVKGYFKLRKLSRNYFINLGALREVVCYALKISSQTFEILLNDAYRLNLQGSLRIRIALEVDRLPEETNAMYLKQEPVMVEGSFRNIIAIDVTKGDRDK